jgi:hypothetical protein
VLGGALLAACSCGSARASTVDRRPLRRRGGDSAGVVPGRLGAAVAYSSRPSGTERRGEGTDRQAVGVGTWYGAARTALNSLCLVAR